MWIRDVDVPRGLVDAARAGSLVIFVGAGASRDEPAGLPDFPSLVKQIGAMVSDPPSKDDIDHPDVYLGRLADRKIDVHRLVAEIIHRPNSQPNRLHRAIVKLAAGHPSSRVVTTNYDLHLTSAAADLALQLPVYEAPALPVGDDFRELAARHTQQGHALDHQVFGGRAPRSLREQAARWRQRAETARRDLTAIQALPVTEAAQPIRDHAAQTQARRDSAARALAQRKTHATTPHDLRPTRPSRGLSL